MGNIELLRRDGSLDRIMLDDEDIALASRHQWRIRRRGKKETVWCHIDGHDVLLHRWLLNNPVGRVRHLDNNGLNNHRWNLEVAAHAPTPTLSRTRVFGMFFVVPDEMVEPFRSIVSRAEQSRDSDMVRNRAMISDLERIGVVRVIPRGQP